MCAAFGGLGTGADAFHLFPFAAGAGQSVYLTALCELLEVHLLLPALGTLGGGINEVQATRRDSELNTVISVER